MARDRNRVPPSQPRKSLPQAADDWFNPPPVPEAREGGESLWEAWQEESRRMDLAFAETQPSEYAPPADAAPAEVPRGRWTTDDVMLLARRNNRVCPRPLLWSALHVLLEGDHYADLAPPPVQPWLWSKLSDLQLRLRFREHVEWAERHGKLEALARYVESLAEPDWLHMGEP